jgi:2-C-methyl-D-erythritol 4-phosphate cytidylyltransferase/2-C-methyl-D-erythritol 2,4-cyclodiphosphate synthase
LTAALVVVGAGDGTRLGADRRKALVEIDGATLLERSTAAFRDVEGLVQRIVVVHPADRDAIDAGPLGATLRALGVDAIVAGGATRQASTLAGVRAVRPEVRDVLVHDAARPFVRAARVRALLAALETTEAAFLAAKVAATVKRVDAAGRVVATEPRESLRLAATPQGGRREVLLRLLLDAEREGFSGTDEAALFERSGIPPRAVEDDVTNVKITVPGDLELVRGLLPAPAPRVGHGYDIHRLVDGRRLVLGGVELPSTFGLLGHSDADVLLHAVIEALLGAAGLPDIGEHFPDTDPRYRGVDSRELLRATLDELRVRGLAPRQVDASIVAERPRLKAFKPEIKASLCALLGLPPDRVAVKARTNEGLDAIGRGEAIAVHCVAVVG